MICSTGSIDGESAISVGTPSAWALRVWASSRLARRQQALVVPRLLDEVPGAPPHGFHREVDRAPGGHDDDRQRLVRRVDAGEQVEPLFAGGGVARVIQVDQDGVVVALLERPERGGRRVDGVGLVALALHEQAQRLEDVALVVGDQNSRNLCRHVRPAVEGRRPITPGRLRSIHMPPNSPAICEVYDVRRPLMGRAVRFRT
jgi:hypothetical protein